MVVVVAATYEGMVEKEVVVALMASAGSAILENRHR
jgi:hypothetical protein